MTKVFITLLNMSLTAAIIIPIILLLRLLFKKAPKLFSYILWVVVLFRLVCPFSFSTEISLLSVLNISTNEQGSVTYIENPDRISNTVIHRNEDIAISENVNVNMNTPVFFEPNPTVQNQQGLNPVIGKPEGNVTVGNKNGHIEVKPNIVQDSQKETRTNLKDTVLQVLSWVWLVGAILLMGYGLVHYVMVKQQLKSARWERDNIYIADSVASPFVCGIFMPKIYMPVSILGEERDYILLHEQIHIKRKDHIIRLVSYFVLSMHWFNPLVWVAYFVSAKDMEMSCDEAVIRKIGNQMKKEYSASLLNLATGKRIIGGMPLAFGEGDTGSRIRNILKYRKPATVILCAALGISVIAMAFLLGNPKTEDAKDTDTGIEAATDIENETGKDSNEEIEPDDSEDSGSPVQPDSNDTPEVIPTKSMTIKINSFDVKARSINSYYDVDDGVLYHDNTLIFSDDCVFYVSNKRNRQEKISVSYEEFLQWCEVGSEYEDAVSIRYIENEVTQAEIISSYGTYGIALRDKKSNHYNYADYLGPDSGQTLKEYYELVASYNINVSEAEGEETVEIYRGNIGDGESGFMLVKDKTGNVIYSEMAHHARAGWNNVFLGQDEKGSFIMTTDQDWHYSFEVFRLDENGNIITIDGLSYNHSKTYDMNYDVDWYNLWGSRYERYWANSYLVLSSDQGILWPDRTQYTATESFYLGKGVGHAYDYLDDNYSNFEENLGIDYSYYYDEYMEFAADFEFLTSYEEFIECYRMYEQAYRDKCMIPFSEFLLEVKFYNETKDLYTGFDNYIASWYEYDNEIHNWPESFYSKDWLAQFHNMNWYNEEPFVDILNGDYTYDNYDSFEENLSLDYTCYYADFKMYKNIYDSLVPYFDTYEEYIKCYRMYEQVYRDMYKIPFSFFLYEINYFSFCAGEYSDFYDFMNQVYSFLNE